jgi:hypothetical protein
MRRGNQAEAKVAPGAGLTRVPWEGSIGEHQT